MSRNRNNKKIVDDEKNIFIPKFTEEEKQQKKAYDNLLDLSNKKDKTYNEDLLSSYSNEEKAYNGFEIFLAFALCEQIYELSIDDIQRNLIQLKEMDKYSKLLNDYTCGANGQFIELIIEVYLLVNAKKLCKSNDNNHIVYSTINSEEASNTINLVSDETKKLMFDLARDFRKLNATYYEEQKTYKKAM